MISYDQAIAMVLENLKPMQPVSMPLQQAGGQVLAEAQFSRVDLPPLDNSAMDGYAFNCAETQAGSELREVAFVPAGANFAGEVCAAEAVRIMTGAPVPVGCNAVVPVEDVEKTEDGIRLRKQSRPGDHIRRRGEELVVGDPILAAGTELHSGAIGLLAAVAVQTVPVHPKPRVAILSTGDELVELEDAPQAGKIVNSNAHMLSARLREEGYQPQLLGIAKDRPGELKALLEKGVASADMLLTTGGVSVGDHDLVQETLERIGFQKHFWQVAIKPGKPVLFGLAGTTPVFGLPGNPAASAATFELFVRPALRRLSGYQDPLAPRIQVELAGWVKGGGKRQQFLWGELRIEQGRLLFVPTGRQSSGQNRSLQGAQALLPVAIGSPDLEAGETVEVLLLRLPPGLAG